MNIYRVETLLRQLLPILLLTGFVSRGSQAIGATPEARLQLRKKVETRVHRGVRIEGEEKIVLPGDTLWRILIIEKGFPESGFHRDLVLVQELNPKIRNPDILQVGEVLFIPRRPDKAREKQKEPQGQEPRIYRVRRGDDLLKSSSENWV